MKSRLLPRLRSVTAAILKSSQLWFVVANLAANLIFIVRSYVTMHSLGYRDLGVVTVMQTVMLLVGTLQFGMLNGGYRLLCSAGSGEARAINNLAYSFFLLVGVVSLIAGIALDQFAGTDVALWVTIIGIVAGVLTLIRNWINNQLIAAGLLNLLNRVTLWSAILSLLPLLAIGRLPLTACIMSVAVQPALFVLAVLLTRRDLRPNAWSLDLVLIRRILIAGFYIFLSGMLLQFNAQVERWYVVHALGLDALGHLYLAFLVVNLFSIVPNALQSLFLPRIIRAWDAKEGKVVSNAVRKLVLANVAYCAIAVLALLLVARPVIVWILPRYTEDLIFAHLILPGLVLYTIGGAMAVMFNVLIQYRSYNIGFGAGSLLTISAFLAVPLFSIRYSLEQISLIKSAVYGLSGGIFLIGFWLLSRAYPDFRFRWYKIAGQADDKN